MSVDTKKSSSWPKRIFWALAALIVLLIFAVIALRIFITTDGGARFIESKLNNRNLGRIERVEVAGLSGDPLDAFTIKSIKVFDRDGLWLTADDIAVDWNPWALRRKVVDIQSASSDAVNVLRRPVLNETEPTGDLPTMQLETASINALNLSEPVIGQPAIFSLSGGMSTRKGGAIKALLDVVRTDAAGDKLHLDFTRSAQGDMQGKFDLNGASGGTLAALLRAPDDTEVIGTGQIGGSVQSGEGDIVISFDGAPKIRTQGNWTETSLSLTSDINTTAWPIFDSVRSGLGDDVDATATLNRAANPAQFDIGVSSSRLQAKASGQLNPDGGMPNAAQISASSDNLGAIVPLPEGFTLGAGSLKGRITSEPNYRFAGDVSVANIATPYGRAASLVGPLVLSQQDENQYSVNSDLVATDLQTDKDLPIKILPKTTLIAKATINTQSSQVSGIEAALTTGDNRLNVTGSANYDVMTYSLAGRTNVRLSQMGALPAGRLQSDFNVNKTSDSLLALSADGAFKPDDAVPAPFDQLLLGGVNFDIDASPVKGGVNIRNAAVTGENIKVAVSGRITDNYNIEGEALLSAPFSYDPVALSGETAASFTLTGERDNPNLRLDARAEKAIVSGYALTDARLRTELNDLLKAPKGPLRFTADSQQGALDFSTDFASRNQLYIANDIDVTWGTLTASGNVSKPASGPATGRLSLNLPRDGDQYAKADLILSANRGVQGIALDAEAKSIAYREWSFDSLVMKAEGDLNTLSGNLDAKGQRELAVLDRQFNINTPFTVSRNQDGSYEASLSPDANYGNIVLDTAAPISASYKDGDIAINAPLTLAESPFNVTYQKAASGETFALKTSGLPITLFPMTGNLADTRGRIGADIELSTSGPSSSVTGSGSISLSDWRGFDVAKGSGLSGDLELNLAGSDLGWDLEAKSPSGFQAQSQGRLPLLPTNTITGLRPNMSAPLLGEFTASGQAAALLGLVTPSDANPGGQLNANLQLSGTAANPNIEGQANATALRMEAPDFGTQVRNGRFTANFTNDTLEVRDVSISDNDKGTITGQGQFKLGEFARPIGELKLEAKNFRALDRKDYEGTVSGKLGFVSTKDEATVTGDITLNRAEVKQFVSGTAAVVEIPVEEINKPENLKEIKTKEPAAPIKLDVKISAPRRIFVRSRGLDVELSVDAKLKGTTSAVQIYGDATVLRGGYKIAGKELAFESGGIKFNGNLGEARVNLVANTDTQNISASVNITGTVANPEIDLSSNPDRPQDEILSALLFGRSATELSTIEAAQLAGALAQFSGAGGGFDLMGGLRDALGVGQLSIGVGQDGAAQITGGRYLAKNVYLQVFSGGGKGQTGAIIEWEVRKNIALTSKIQADNDQSFSLKWKRDF